MNLLTRPIFTVCISAYVFVDRNGPAAYMQLIVPPTVFCVAHMDSGCRESVKTSHWTHFCGCINCLFSMSVPYVVATLLEHGISMHNFSGCVRCIYKFGREFPSMLYK